MTLLKRITRVRVSRFKQVSSGLHQGESGELVTEGCKGNASSSVCLSGCRKLYTGGNRRTLSALCNGFARRAPLFPDCAVPAGNLGVVSPLRMA